MKEIEKRMLDLFKALSSPTRYKIIKLLDKEGEASVNIIGKTLKKDHSTISKHLKILRDLNIVRYYTKGNTVFYRLKNKAVLKVLCEAKNFVKRK